MPLQKLGDFEGAPDEHIEFLLKLAESKARQAVLDLIAPVVAEFPDVVAAAAAAAGPAVDEAVAARDLLASTDPQVPQIVADMAWKHAIAGSNNMVPFGVDEQDRTFIAEFHPSMYMPDRDSADVTQWALRNPSTGDTPLAYGNRGLFAADIHPNTPLPRHRIYLQESLLPGELLPDDGQRPADALFQRAAARAASLVPFFGPVEVVIPAGRFRLVKGVDVYGMSGVGWAGAGRNDTTLLPCLGASAFIARIPTGYDGPDHEDVSFRDFTIDGAGQGGSGSMTNVKGIYIQRMIRARFENVTIKNVAATGFGVDFLQDAWFINCYAENCGRLIEGDSSTGAGFGFATGLYPVESIRMINCTSRNNRSHGVFLERGASRLAALPGAPGGYRSMGFTMIGCWMEGNYDGYFGSGGTMAVLQGNTFYKNRFAGIFIDENTTTTIADDLTQIRGNVIYGNGWDTTAGTNRGGIRIRGTQVSIPPVIDGNVISWNDGWGVKITDNLAGDGLWITRNQIFENLWSGVSVTSGTGPHRARIEDNDVWNNGRGGTGVTGEEDGIVIHNRVMNRTRIIGNRSWDRRSTGKTQKRGLALTGGNLWTTPRVSGNDLDGNATAGLVDELDAATVRTYITDNITA
ncbi:right-handed parallel beta-helix repeat-containing protein [Microbacterium sp.]|jgi:hypothetical protein|uniref:right-handed parallel beta-helix repeat-containing protein n=1 Tax=Microbacterium sp. TaxID=51671 RepID=UPI0037C63644